ncbi:hypothetical protein TNCV_1677291 [Trichonephila clavipes]|nr:hypothetical protein TNCV_1677291 [Trichonephila clavipes]
MEHIFARLELQVQDYVEVRNPTTTAKLNMRRRDRDVRRMSNDDRKRIVERKSLAIPDSLVKKIIPSFDEGNLDIDFTKIILEEGRGERRKCNGLPPDNPEAYRLAVDYRKLNSITKYPRYPLPLIENLIMNILHTELMSSLDLHSGYFQLAVNPSDVVKTAYVTQQGTYAFTRMPFGLSGVAPNFQKLIDMILKPVIG